MSSQIGETLKQLQAEVDSLKPAREAAAAALPAKVIAEFDRLSDRFDGEALSALAKPDRRREEYLCTACNMDLVTDVYNKLHSRDELVFCPSCRRVLFIPEDLPPEAAINVKGGGGGGVARAGEGGGAARPKAPRATRTRGSKASAAAAAGAETVIEQRAKGKLGEVLAKAQGESVSRAAAADHKPFDFEVYVDGALAGIYKGNSAENLERAIKYFLGEAGLTGAVRVVPPAATQPAATGPAGTTPPEATAPEVTGAAEAAAPEADPRSAGGSSEPQPAGADSSGGA